MFLIEAYIVGTHLNYHDRFIKACVVGTHLNCLDLSRQFKRVPTMNAFIKEPDKIYSGFNLKSKKLLDLALTKRSMCGN